MANGQSAVSNVNLGTTTERPWYQFGLGEGKQVPITGYEINPEAVGTMTELEKQNFYDYMNRAGGQGQDVYQQQAGLAATLQARAEGRGTPSLAELQLQQTLEGNRRSLAGQLAAQGRSMNPALAQKLLLSKGADLQQQSAGQGAILRAQEQIAAQGALANQLGSMATSQGNIFSSAGTLGFNQAKEQAQLAENQKTREYNAALANLNAATGGAAGVQQSSQTAQAQAGQNAKTAIEAGGKIIQEGNKAANNPTAPPAGKAQGGMINAAAGYLAKLDNKKNDVVPAMLSPGEVVLPRSIVNSPNPPAAAAKFVEAILAKKNKKDAKMEALRVALKK